MPRNLYRHFAFAILVFSLAPYAAADFYRGPTQDAKYRLIVQSPDGDILLNEVQSWTVTVLDGQGNPVTPRSLVFLGGMPGHGHGLPSMPRVTTQLSPGRFLVEGVKLNMYGDWEIVIGVSGSAGPDKATIPFRFKPPEASFSSTDQWSATELALLRSLWLDTHVETPRDPSNRFDGLPDAIRLGERLFHDPGLSRDANISCANCHVAELAFTDARPTSMGSKKLSRNSQTLQGIARAKWFYWDGRRDSLWAQALTPIETPGEMDSNRAAVVAYVLSNEDYRSELEELGVDLITEGELPQSAGPYGDEDARLAWSKLPPAERERINSMFATIGKIIASYVASLEPSTSRFDRYVAHIVNNQSTDGLLNDSEIRGLKLFLDSSKTHCMRCHNGPYFSSFGFHNIGTGLNRETGARDFGRLFGLKSARLDEFNCTGRYSDLDANECRELNYSAEGHADDGAFKVPGLRDIVLTSPYFHDGRFQTLMRVMEFYRMPPDAAESGNELLPLGLSDEELQDLAAFLGSLTGEGGKDSRKPSE